MRSTIAITALIISLASCTAPSESTTAPTAKPTPTADPNTFKGDGLYKIGDDVKPGEYKTAGHKDCFYAILNSSRTDDIADSELIDGPARVSLQAGKYFETKTCADWVLAN